MTKSVLSYLIDERRGIEFTFNNKDYYIDYHKGKRKEYIKFSEFFKKPKLVKDINELWELIYNDIKIGDMISSIKDYKVSVFL